MVDFLLFATKFVHVARFTGPRPPCFAESNETPGHGVTQRDSCVEFYPIRSQNSHNIQKPHLLQDRFDTWLVKVMLCVNSFCRDVEKQVERACWPF